MGTPTSLENLEALQTHVARRGRYLEQARAAAELSARARAGAVLVFLDLDGKVRLKRAGDGGHLDRRVDALGMRTWTLPLAAEKRMSPSPSTRVSSTSTSPLALLALTLPAASLTLTVPLAEAARISPLTPESVTSPLAVLSSTLPVTFSAVRLPLAVLI